MESRWGHVLHQLSDAAFGYQSNLNLGAVGSSGQGSRPSDLFLTRISQELTCEELHGFADTDGDGLLDRWEINGLDVNSDGIIDLDLPAFRRRQWGRVYKLYISPFEAFSGTQM